MNLNQTRILYTFRRCPYAIRARMAICSAGIDVEFHEVSLKNKPAAMLAVSQKGTVPVLCDGDRVIDESLDIMLWALGINDPEQWVTGYSGADNAVALSLIRENDSDFKPCLDKYKYADRFPEHEPAHHRRACEMYLARLDAILQKQPHLVTPAVTLADIAIFPFVRQFSMVNRDWFERCRFDALRIWLHGLLELPIFERVMAKQQN